MTFQTVFRDVKKTSGNENLQSTISFKNYYPRAAAENTIQNGYKMIFFHTEEKCIYFAFKGGDMSEILRSDLIEMIQNRKPIPILEIKEKIQAATQSAFV